MGSKIIKLNPFNSENILGYEQQTLTTHKSGHSKIKYDNTTLTDHIGEELTTLNKIIQADDTLLVQVYSDNDLYTQWNCTCY